MTTLYVDGYDLSARGVQVESRPIEGWLDAPEVSRESAPIAGSTGGSVSRHGVIGPRAITIPIHVLPDVYGASQREAIEDECKWFHNRLVRVRLSDGATAKEIVGWWTRLKLRPATEPTPQASKGEIHLLCPEATWRGLVGRTDILGAGRTAVTFGTAPTKAWVLQVWNTSTGLTDITITIRDGGGLVLATLTWTGTLTATEYLEINALAGTVRKYSAGAYTNAIGTFAGGMPLLDPYDMTTVALAAASGTPTGTLRTIPRYW